MILSNLSTIFPGEPREIQSQALDKIERALSEGYKYIICQAPTGTGKSHLAATLSLASKPVDSDLQHLYSEYHQSFANTTLSKIEDYIEKNGKMGSVVLTSSKALQDQYYQIFGELKEEKHRVQIFKGLTNYSCAIEAVPTDLAPCRFNSKQKKICCAKRICPYYNAREDSLINHWSCLNYSVYLELNPFLRKRELIIADEATEIETSLVNHYSLDLQVEKYKKHKLESLLHLPFPSLKESKQKIWDWLIEVKQSMGSKLEDLEDVLQNSSGASKKEIKLAKEQFLFLGQQYLKVSQICDYYNQAEFLIDYVDRERFYLVPLYIHPFFKQFLNNADYFFFFSATILSAKLFTNTLGLDKEQYKFIDLPSEFNPKKSPIFCPGGPDLSWKNIDKNLPIATERALKICRKFKGKKGVVHTHSFKITQAFQKALYGAPDQDRYLIRNELAKNEYLLKQHREFADKDTVIISPSISFGIDLPKEFGEFAIIMKLPYLPLGSKRIETLFQKNKPWYIYRMLITLIQSVGRTIRSKEDTSLTFILDPNIVRVLEQNWDMLPAYFRDRLV